MKIVFYSVSVSPYGAPTSLLNLVEGLIAKHDNCEIYVVVPKHGPLTDRLKKLNVRLLVIPFYKWTYKHKYYLSLQKKNGFHAWLWFRKNLYQKLFLNVLFLPVHLFRIGFLKPDIIYVNASMSPMGILVAKLLGIKSLWHHREPLNDVDTDFFVEWPSRISKKILNWPNVRIYNSNFLMNMYQSLAQNYGGKSYVVYNGVPSSAEGSRSTHSRPVFGIVGKIEKGVRKGQAEVIDIFSHDNINDAVLNIYGGGEPSYIEVLKEQSNPQRVHFKGLTKQQEIYSEIDFLIVNSRNESFGRVVAEAYAFGVPVLALRSGALPEIIDQNETGFIYESRDQLSKLIQKGTELIGTTEYVKMQDNCRRKHVENFTITSYTKIILDIIKSIVQ